MKINGSGPINNAPIRRKTGSGGASSTSFADALAGEQPARGAAASADVAASSALVAAQEVADPLAERRRAVRHGQDLLDRLEDIRHGLLTGAIPPERLEGLLRAVRQRQEATGDPKLREVLGEIELRASVELAKLGAFG